MNLTSKKEGFFKGKHTAVHRSRTTTHLNFLSKEFDDKLFGDRNMHPEGEISLENTHTNFTVRTNTLPKSSAPSTAFHKRTISDRLNQFSAQLAASARKPSIHIKDFYLSKIDRSNSRPALENSLIPEHASTPKAFNITKISSKPQWVRTLEQSSKEFSELNKQEVLINTLQKLPIEAREFIDNLALKNKTSLKSHILTFEKHMHCLLDIHSQITAYKPELGLATGSVISDIRQVWTDTVTCFVKIINQVQLLEDKARQDILQSHKDDQRENRLLQLKIDSLNEVIMFKDINLDIAKSKIEAAEREIKDLQDSKLTLTQMLKNIQGEVGQAEKNATLVRLEDLQTKVKELTKEYNRIESEKLKQGEHILKLDLLTKQNFCRIHKDFEVQVDEGELMWGLSSLKRETNVNPLFSHLNDRVSALVYNQNGTFEDPLKFVAASSTGHGGSSDKDNLSMNSGMFTELNSSHNNQQSVFAQPDPKRRKPRGGTIKKKVTVAPLPPESIVWQIPFGLCKFLEDVHGQYSDVSVVAWHIFRQEIFQLLEERLIDDWEIVGSPTNSSVPFEEYLVLYFIRKTTHPRLAALKLLEFLSSLKFYSAKWKRAYLCSLVCNLMRRKDQGIYDYYLQHYYLYLFSRLLAMKQFWIEKEHTTYIHFDRLHDFLAAALEFLDQDRYSREMGGFEMKTEIVEGKDGFIEIDEVLFTCINLFLEEYMRRIEISKKAMKQHCHRQGKDLGFRDFCKVLDDSLSSRTTIKHLCFGATLNKSRAFVLYCNLYSGKKRSIEDSFELALRRYGLAIPFPMFINEITIKNGLQDGPTGEGSGTSLFKKNKELAVASPLPLKSLIEKRGGRQVGPKNASAEKPSRIQGVVERLKAQAEEDTTKKRLSMYTVEATPNPLGSGKKLAITLKQGSSRLIETSVVKVSDAQTPNSKQPNNNATGIELEDKAQISSSLIAQHFSILRELHQYCTLLRENVGPDPTSFNAEEAWRSLNRLIELLDAGCDFLNYPLKI